MFQKEIEISDTRMPKLDQLAAETVNPNSRQVLKNKERHESKWMTKHLKEESTAETRKREYNNHIRQFVQAQKQDDETIIEEQPYDDEPVHQDTQYEQLMKYANQPPVSKRKNKPLGNSAARLPQWFDFEQKYEIRKDVIMVPKKILTDSQLDYILFGRASKLKSPFHGSIRFCRVHRRW